MPGGARGCCQVSGLRARCNGNQIPALRDYPVAEVHDVRRRRMTAMVPPAATLWLLEAVSHVAGLSVCLVGQSGEPEPNADSRDPAARQGAPGSLYR